MQLNQTYLYYGKKGAQRQKEQALQDTNASSLGSSAYAKRAQVKSGKNYRNDAWDLVDAVAKNKDALKELDKTSLPEDLRELDTAALEAKIAELAAERKKISEQLNKLVEERSVFVNEERARLVAEGAEATLGEALNQSFRAIAAEQGYEVQNSEQSTESTQTETATETGTETGVEAESAAKPSAEATNEPSVKE